MPAGSPFNVATDPPEFRVIVTSLLSPSINLEGVTLVTFKSAFIVPVSSGHSSLYFTFGRGMVR
jgi:hypothetical protein